MILQALHQLYLRLLDDPDSGISSPGYATKGVSFALNLSEAGELLDVYDLRIQQGGARSLRPRNMSVPRPVVRPGTGVSANFLCDDCCYVLGADNKPSKRDPERAVKKLHDFRALHGRILGSVDDAGARAVLAFLRHWDPQKIGSIPLHQDIMGVGNIVFRLDGSDGFVHERHAIRLAWELHTASLEPEQTNQCLVTGQEAPIARLHDWVKGVRGAPTTGAPLVTFNLPAFTSYAKKQSHNAPVSEAAAFGYVTALNYLLRHRRHRLQMGETTTVVFWAERRGFAEDLFAALVDPDRHERAAESTEGQEPHVDPAVTALVRDVLARAAQGLPACSGLPEAEMNVRFHILGLSPNSARLAVRFWHINSFGMLVRKVVSHHADMVIESPPWTPPLFSAREILRQTAPLGDLSRASPLLGGALMRSIVLGTPYPQGLYAAMLLRTRAGNGPTGGGVTPLRAAVIKACLLRRAQVHGLLAKEEVLSVALNEASNDPAYLLGRLFAVLEKAQEDATPGINATIRDRYFGSASATPRAVFPVLLRLAQHHIAKAEYGGVSDRRVEDILGRLDGFPAHLSLDQQGVFVLGYYHQRQAFYQRKAAAAQASPE